MIVKTRYRNIPWEKVLRVHHMIPPFPGERWQWEKKKGVEVELVTPGVIGACGSLSFTATDGRQWACEHIAEIGD